MTLRVKALTLVLVSVIVLMGSIELLFSRVLLNQMASLEREQMTQHAVRVQEAIRAKVKSIPKHLLDWAAWDDTYEYMETRDPGYVESNLVTAGIVGLESNFIIYFDTQKKPVLQKALDFRAAREIEVPAALFSIFSPNSTFLADMALDDARSGIIELEGKPLLFGLRPIIKSDKTGPPRGVILWARFFDDVEILDLKHELQLDFTITLPSRSTVEVASDVGTTVEPFARATSNDEIRSFATVEDFYGTPGLNIEVVGHRDIFRRGLEANALVIIGLLLSGLIFALIVALALEKVVILRISRVARGLRRIAREDDFEGRLEIEGKDEIADLANEINDTLEALAQGRHGLEVAMNIAETASANKSMFVSTMSHEIRTPLNGILGMTESLARDDLTPQQREKLIVLSDCAESLIAIVNDVLDFAKIEAGKVDLELIDFELSALVQRCINTVSERAKKKGILLQTKVADSIPKYLVGDPTRLGQVIINLLSNAVKFTDTGSVTLSVSVSQLSEEQVHLTFAVVDTGIGMTPLQTSRVFEAFNQADASIARRFGGTGLGLSICQKIVGIMGSSLQVNSSPGLGSRFYFDVSMAIGNSSSAKSPLPSAGTIVPVAPMRVLVVDDKESNRKVASLHLRSLGHECVTLHSGEALLHHFSEIEKGSAASADIVFLDIQMPLMSGPEAAKLMRETPFFSERKIPIIALTAQAASDFGLTPDVRDLFDEWVAKPLRMSDLERVLAKFQSKVALNESPAIESEQREAWPNIPQLDSGYLWEQYCDEMTITEMLECFLDENTAMIDELDGSMVSIGNGETLARALHALRGSILNIGAFKLASASKELEAAVLDPARATHPDSASQIAAWREDVIELRAIVAAKIKKVGSQADLSDGVEKPPAIT